jgi:glycosyltransferase involved in cell wall biosynthesis
MNVIPMGGPAQRPDPSLSGVSLVIPAYNEEASIGAVVAKAIDVLRSCGVEFEVIVVDDGSGDRTGALAQAAGARVVSHPHNRGYGNSLKSGIQAARYENVIICDADESYPLEQIPLLMADADRYQMIIGARQGKWFHGSFFKRMGRAAQLGLVRFAAGTKVPDANSGFRLIKRSLAAHYFDFACTGFSYTTSITIAMLCEQHSVKFVNIDYHKRTGRSHVRYFRDTARSLQIVVQCILRYNPLKAFLAAGAVMAVPTVGFLLLSLLHPLYLLGTAVCGCAAYLTCCMGMLAYAAGHRPERERAIDAGVYTWPALPSTPGEQAVRERNSGREKAA